MVSFTVTETQSHIEDFAQAFTVLDDSTESPVRRDWSRLVVQRDVKGKAAHDARLIAAMNVYGLTSILTFNKAHFTRYPVNVIFPEDVAPES